MLLSYFQFLFTYRISLVCKSLENLIIHRVVWRVSTSSMFMICLLSAQAQLWYTWCTKWIWLPWGFCCFLNKMAAFKILGLWGFNFDLSSNIFSSISSLFITYYFLTLRWRQRVIRQEDKMLTHQTVQSFCFPLK